MTLERLQTVHRAEPFRPFTLHLTNGRSLRVPHPEFLWVPPEASRTVFVATGPETAEFVDILMIVSIELSNAKASRRNGRRR